jgi:hypothetical protein
LPLHQNVYYRDLPEEIQKELWGRFFGTAVPRRMAIFAEDGHPRSRHPKAAA